jgi:hypothetical protein
MMTQRELIDMVVTEAIEAAAVRPVTTSSALFSPCRRYRYELWRRWSSDGRYCMFIGLNPSTADETLDDPTIRRCVRFARDWGFGAMLMCNLFAFRATDPQVMKAEDEPIGSENDRWLIVNGSAAGIVVAAWGVHGAHLNRGNTVRSLLGWKLQCLGVTKDGFPRHPLYLPLHTKPIHYL